LRCQQEGGAERRDDPGIDPVGLLQHAHRLGKKPDLARIGDGAGQAPLRQQQEGPAFIATGRLHRHLIVSAEALGEEFELSPVAANTTG